MHISTVLYITRRYNLVILGRIFEENLYKPISFSAQFTCLLSKMVRQKIIKTANHIGISVIKDNKQLSTI